ncbi:DUF4105 domain-containing protein [Rhodohalobacter mucosus]|uniref:Lnb N-terminal periplasmic domain-containing protein n=1 Tax=Rhodohalobacter mucosus TaxID=2079485 RepID=UPI001304D3AE|nr:DUF4105 domain-containing protein [Rhodohalobacter mucosus]
MRKIRFRHILLTLLLVVPLVLVVTVLTKTASNDREWSPDQQILAYAEFAADADSDSVTIRNIRNSRYRSPDDYVVSHYDRTVSLGDLVSLDYMVEKLEGFPGFAHTLLSFGFADSTYIAISVEIRKELGESYHPLSGMMREYELMYVIADERDVINLRANYRGNTVYLYPIEIGRASLTNLFLSMLERANGLRENPEFYHTLTSTCTTNLARAASETTEERFWMYHPQILLPGFSDRLLLKRSLIQTGLTDIDDVREAFMINAQAESHRDSEGFSLGIRNLSN